VRTFRKLIFSILLLFSFSVPVFLGQSEEPFQSLEQALLEQATQPSHCVMTVFVHGTIALYYSPQAIVDAVKFFWRGVKDKVYGKGLFYDTYDAYMKTAKLCDICKAQPIGNPGLDPIDVDGAVDPDDFEYTAHRTARLYEMAYNAAYPTHTNQLAFFTYNWSGALSAKSRLATAYGFYDALLQKRDELAVETGLPVKIELLAHSHGVNVILNLAAVEAEKQKGLYLDKVTFYGGPIQKETEPFIASKIFGKKYNLYSTNDPVQVIDFVTTSQFFSRRTFGATGAYRSALPSDLYQIELKIGKYRPSHYELWSWWREGTKNFVYHKNFPFHPFPISVTTPLITSLVDEIDMSDEIKRNCKCAYDEKSNTFCVEGAKKRVEKSADVLHDMFEYVGLLEGVTTSC